VAFLLKVSLLSTYGDDANRSNMFDVLHLVLTFLVGFFIAYYLSYVLHGRSSSSSCGKPQCSSSAPPISFAAPLGKVSLPPHYYDESKHAKSSTSAQAQATPAAATAQTVLADDDVLDTPAQGGDDDAARGGRQPKGAALLRRFVSSPPNQLLPPNLDYHTAKGGHPARDYAPIYPRSKSNSSIRWRPPCTLT
jgi:hypothetical protein